MGSEKDKAAMAPASGNTQQRNGSNSGRVIQITMRPEDYENPKSLMGAAAGAMLKALGKVDAIKEESGLAAGRMVAAAEDLRGEVEHAREYMGNVPRYAGEAIDKAARGIEERAEAHLAAVTVKARREADKLAALVDEYAARVAKLETVGLASFGLICFLSLAGHAWMLHSAGLLVVRGWPF